MSKYNYKWNFKDVEFSKDKGKVFSCFAGGGGSSMGYKLAGFDVIGCNEIDEKMINVYKANHNPKYAFLEQIQTFKNRTDLPKELFELDILDGSPPCSSFSMSGSRADDWGVERQFKEGQAMQVLDTLFFDFIDLAKRLQPKVVIAENVKGLMMGEAKQYVIKIYKEFEKAGYNVQHWLLDASDMGVPQRRERVFFIALRNDLCEPFMYQKDLFTLAPELRLEFNEPKITFGEFYQPGVDDRPCDKMIEAKKCWDKREPSDTSLIEAANRIYGVDKFWNYKLMKLNEVSLTYTAHKDGFLLYDEFRKPNKYESCCIGTFPLDYDFGNELYYYLIGMSVPPIMIARIADEVYKQWLCKTIKLV